MIAGPDGVKAKEEASGLSQAGRVPPQVPPSTISGPQGSLMAVQILFVAREVADGGWRSRMRPEALIFAGRQLLDGWSVMDPLVRSPSPRW